jgi:hypothetical protein
MAAADVRSVRNVSHTVLLENFCKKLRRKDTHKTETSFRFTSLDETNNDDGVRTVKFATSRNLDVKTSMFHL